MRTRHNSQRLQDYHIVSTPAAILDILSASQPVVESTGRSSYVGLAFANGHTLASRSNGSPSRTNSHHVTPSSSTVGMPPITPAPCRISISLYIDKVRVWIGSSPVEPAVDIKFEERKSKPW
jgi:hypothetical protein